MNAESWSSRIGVILAVSGSAVGLGNFLKFPGQVALYGGAAFMIAYVISFFALGLPISIIEFTVGRHGGANGYNSPSGILGFFCKSKKMAYFGVLGSLLTLMIFCYYVYIESWCLGYAYNFAVGTLKLDSVEASSAFFADFIGVDSDGSAFGLGLDKVLVFLIFSFFLNFWMIYRGVSRGIEFFCKYAMPTLVLLAIVIVIRMMTVSGLSPDHPERTINQGLGFMWNPVKVVLQENVGNAQNPKWVDARRLVGESDMSEAKKIVAEAPTISGSPSMRIHSISVFRQLQNPSIWIAAAGQVFFSLTVGFGCIMTYASYLRRKDDIVLSSITSCSANEFCEVCLGGMITVPAAVALFGVSGVLGAGLSLFDLGFKVLPLFFLSMPLGEFFGFLFFFLLFLAAVTSSLSMLQPSMAFIEEATGLKRRFSTSLLCLITFFISGFVAYFSKDLKAMDTFDFWMGQVAVYVFAMVLVTAFSWYFGVERGMKLANYGSIIKLPHWFGFLARYITPTVLLLVFVVWIGQDILGVIGDGKLSPYIRDLVGGEDSPPNKVAWKSVAIMVMVGAFYSLIVLRSGRYSDLKSLKRRK